MIANGVLPLCLSLTITAFGGPEGYFSHTIIGFGAFEFVVPKDDYRLGAMEIKQSRLLDLRRKEVRVFKANKTPKHQQNTVGMFGIFRGCLQGNFNESHSGMLRGILEFHGLSCSVAGREALNAKQVQQLGNASTEPTLLDLRRGSLFSSPPELGRRRIDKNKLASWSRETLASSLRGRLAKFCFDSFVRWIQGGFTVERPRNNLGANFQ